MSRLTAMVSFLFLSTFWALPPGAAEPDQPWTLAAALESQGISVRQSRFHGYPQREFALDGKPCRIVSPRQPAPGRPWVWRARFWGHEPQFDRAMLQRGWHVCYCDVSNLYGADPAVERWNRFYSLARRIGLHDKPILEAMSRGGLIAMRWAAANPRHLGGIYLDNAVLDIRSWPGGQGEGKGSPADWQRCLQAYGLDESGAATLEDGPLARLQPLAEAAVPMIVLMNLADDVVPPAENGELLVSRYQALGGSLTVVRRPGLGHHPHSLKDPSSLVDFAISNTRAEKIETTHD